MAIKPKIIRKINISLKSNIILGLIIAIKKRAGKKIKNLINWRLAQGSNDPLAAENKLTSPIQKIMGISKKYIQFILNKDLSSLNI